jgi:hypothetical protein
MVMQADYGVGLGSVSPLHLHPDRELVYWQWRAWLRSIRLWAWLHRRREAAMARGVSPLQRFRYGMALRAVARRGRGVRAELGELLARVRAGQGLYTAMFWGDGAKSRGGV